MRTLLLLACLAGLATLAAPRSLQGKPGELHRTGRRRCCQNRHCHFGGSAACTVAWGRARYAAKFTSFFPGLQVVH